MAGLPGTHFLFSRGPAVGNTRDYSQRQSRPAPPAPPTPPAPPAPPAPSAPPAPPAPPVPPIVVINGQPVMEPHYLSEDQNRPEAVVSAKVSGSNPNVCTSGIPARGGVRGNRRKPPPELTLKWISKAWKAVPKELIQRSFITCGISNALDGSQDNLCMQHRRDAVKGEVELDDEIATDGFCCNNVEEPESDGEADQDGSATVDGDA
ncbi:unnamed protein product [Closterium sp. NIES-53]